MVLDFDTNGGGPSMLFFTALMSESDLTFRELTIKTGLSRQFFFNAFLFDSLKLSDFSKILTGLGMTCCLSYLGQENIPWSVPSEPISLDMVRSLIKSKQLSTEELDAAIDEEKGTVEKNLRENDFDIKQLIRIGYAYDSPLRIQINWADETSLKKQKIEEEIFENQFSEAVKLMLFTANMTRSMFHGDNYFKDFQNFLLDNIQFCSDVYRIGHAMGVEVSIMNTK